MGTSLCGTFRRTRHWFARISAIAVVVGCTSTDDDLSTNREMCTKLRSHVIDVRLAGMTNVDVEAHRTAFESSLGDAFLDGCEKTFTNRQVNCALGASDSDAIETCTHASVAITR